MTCEWVSKTDATSVGFSLNTHICAVPRFWLERLWRFLQTCWYLVVDLRVLGDEVHSELFWAVIGFMHWCSSSSCQQKNLTHRDMQWDQWCFAASAKESLIVIASSAFAGLVATTVSVTTLLHSVMDSALPTEHSYLANSGFACLSPKFRGLNHGLTIHRSLSLHVSEYVLLASNVTATALFDLTADSVFRAQNSFISCQLAVWKQLFCSVWPFHDKLKALDWMTFREQKTIYAGVWDLWGHFSSDGRYHCLIDHACFRATESVFVVFWLEHTSAWSLHPSMHYIEGQIMQAGTSLEASLEASWLWSTHRGCHSEVYPDPLSIDSGDTSTASERDWDCHHCVDRTESTPTAVFGASMHDHFTLCFIQFIITAKTSWLMTMRISIQGCHSSPTKFSKDISANINSWNTFEVLLLNSDVP